MSLFKPVVIGGVEFHIHRSKPFKFVFFLPDRNFESNFKTSYWILHSFPLCSFSPHSFVSGIPCSSCFIPPLFGGCFLHQLLSVVPHNRACVQLICYLFSYPFPLMSFTLSCSCFWAQQLHAWSSQQACCCCLCDSHFFFHASLSLHFFLALLFPLAICCTSSH